MKVLVAKVLTPVKVLLFASNVDEAAETVMEPPSATLCPLTVTAPLPCRRLLPMVLVAMSLPEASVARSEPLSPVNQVVAKVARVEEALAMLRRQSRRRRG